jgi:ATP-dependent Lon protease
MPGKLIQGMKRAGTMNPVLLLDEIDKLGQSYQGDPASALLEVLDPEQNATFLDHYLDVPYDLSKVLFVLTANSTATIPAALLDRMEVIATQYVIPKELEKHGLKPAQLKIERSALRRMMNDYAREPGLRSLQQLLNRICRKAAVKIVAKGPKSSHAKSSKPAPITITEASLASWLGPQRFHNELAERISVPGVVVGLAWTAMGGDILFIEASDLPGSGNIKLTGQMGEVMTESAAIAWSYVKKKLAHDNKYDRRYFRNHDFHLHIPAGAIPKDGPSAGVTMATALYSLLSGRKIKPKLAMTGELSLVGKVLAVGGIKEKILAARRAGITTILLPKHNEKDMAEVPEYAKKGISFHFVSSVEEVFRLALQEGGSFKREVEPRVLRISARTGARAKKQAVGKPSKPGKSGTPARTHR